MIFKTILLNTLGFVTLILGMIGVFVPLWPTTPFLLLSVGCFSVNPAIQQRILKIKFIREHVQNYKERVGLKRSNVITSLIFLWMSMLISMLTAKRLLITMILLAIDTALTVYIIIIAKPKKVT